MRAALVSAVLLIGVSFWPAAALMAAAPDIEHLIQRAEHEGFVDPEAEFRDATAAIAALERQPNADLEIRARQILCEYQSERDLGAAEEQAQRALALLPRARDPASRAGLLTCQGNARQTAGDTVHALKLLTGAVEVATNAHQDAALASALYSRGHLLGIEGDYAAALADLRRAQILFEHAGRRYDAVSCRDAVATLYRRMGDKDQAVHLYREVLRLQQQEGMLREQAVTLQNLGRTYQDSRQWDLAQGAFGQALDLARSLKYPRVEAYALRGLAAVKIAHADAAGALQDLEHAAALQEATPDVRLAAQIDLQKGRALHLAGRLAESAIALRSAREVFQSGDSAPELVEADGELAVVEAALGDWRTAYVIRTEAAQYQDQLLSHQIDERFAALKLQFDTVAQEQENHSLLRENAEASAALSQSRRVRQLQGVVILLGLALGAVLLGLLIFNRGRARRMGSLAMTDELTQVPNRRAVLAELGKLLKRPEAAPCAMLIMDIDFFKRVNDQHGHAAGDEVLKLVAQAVRSTVVSPAFFGRLGGEEFLIVVPDADLTEARRQAEQLRQTVAGIGTRHVIPGHPGVTTSVGLTLSRIGADDPGSMLARADSALYAAKRSGRNCVRIEPAPDDATQEMPRPKLLEE